MNARLELLRALAMLEDVGRTRDNWPEWVPVFESDQWQNSAEDIVLAVDEAAKLGQIEAVALHASTDPTDRMVAQLRGGREWVVKITPAGSAWIRAHDGLGELAQEGDR